VTLAFSTVIPGRREAASPESIATAVDGILVQSDTACFVFMDSGLTPSARPGMTD
jgi:hypothetical protein